MSYEVTLKGKLVRLKLTGEKESLADLKAILELALQFENGQQINTEQEDSLNNWWELPQDLVKDKETGVFLAREADLNPALHYDKTSFSLRILITDGGKTLIVDHGELRKALDRLEVREHIPKTKSCLIRLKGDLKRHHQKEIEDYLRKMFSSVESVKIVFEKRQYGTRATFDLLLFGDFPPE